MRFAAPGFWRRMLDHERGEDLAPNGTLRAAINVGNAVLAQRAAGGEPTGISVDLARELGRRLGVPVQLIVFDAAGKVVEAASRGRGTSPSSRSIRRAAAEIAQVAAVCPDRGRLSRAQRLAAQSNDEVDRKGHRVVVARNSAYDLYLSRAETSRDRAHGHFGAVVDTFVKNNYEVAAGVKQQLENDARRVAACACCPGASW